MNPYQQTAYGSPCFHAEQCAQEKYRHMKTFRSRQWSIILTANIGLE